MNERKQTRRSFGTSAKIEEQCVSEQGLVELLEEHVRCISSHELRLDVWTHGESRRALTRLRIIINANPGTIED